MGREINSYIQTVMDLFCSPSHSHFSSSTKIMKYFVRIGPSSITFISFILGFNGHLNFALKS